MKRFALCTILSLLLVFVYSCGSKNNEEEKLTEIAVIQTVNIDLQATNMSGYDWYLYSCDEDIAMPKTENAVCLSADGATRKNDIYRFTFEAISSGTATAEFRYAKGVESLENAIGKAIYTITVDENRSITAKESSFEDPKSYVFIEDLGDVAMENLSKRTVSVTLPDNEQDSNSWYYTIVKKEMAAVAKDVFVPDANHQWGNRTFYIEAAKRGKFTITFYYIPDTAINGTAEVPTMEEVGENGEIVTVPVAESALQYACDTAQYRAEYIVEVDKSMHETIKERNENLPDTSVMLAPSAETVFAESELDTSDPDLKYQVPEV